eukprot:g9150.t1
MKLYLIAEVKYLGEIATQQKEQEVNLKRQRDETSRVMKRKRLEERYKVKVSDIRPILRPFVLGDYLQSVRSKTLLRQVKRRYSEKDRATELMDTCKAHPLAALAFCEENPDGSVDKYMKLRENMRTAFTAEGSRIMSMLRPIDRQKLKASTVLNDVLDQYQNRDAKGILFKKLEEKVGSAIARDIMRHSACEQRINRGGDETEVANKLIEFWESKDNKALRQANLEDALQAQGLHLREDSRFCKEYINGRIDVDLDEIVGIMMITSHLFDISYVAWSTYSDDCERKFRQCLIDEQLALDQAVSRALNMIPRRIPHYIEYPEVHHHHHHYYSDFVD